MRAALIGAGQIARQHLACLKTLPSVELTAICDLSPATAEAAAERYGVRAWFTDHRLMLEKVRPEVVHITTPPTSHFQLAMDSFDAGAHVIVEKPATTTFEELETLVRRAQEAGRHLAEDYNYVFNQAPQEILRGIDSGEFGAVAHVEVLHLPRHPRPGRLRRSQFAALRFDKETTQFSNLARGFDHTAL